MSNTRNRFSPEVRARAVRMVMEQESEYTSRWAAILPISSKIGCAPQTLNNWIKTSEMGSGKRVKVPTEVSKKLKALERKNKELERANKILRKGFGVFHSGEARPPTQKMISFIDTHRSVYGVEPICKCLPIAQSTYYANLAVRRNPDKLSTRKKMDMILKPEIKRVFTENREAYGARRIWQQMQREGYAVGLCTVARLMREMGLRGLSGANRSK